MDRWYWIELIGFDNEAADFGVDAFLSRNVNTTGVSLLFAHIDFLFEQQNELLAPTACSYGGHEYNRERRRQQWTKAQLRGLVNALHARGVKVLFACFDMTERITDKSWLCYNKRGTPSPLVYVLKRLDDGRYVGDIVIERLHAVLRDYGFDGLQLADGLSSNRPSIENGDFSLPFCRQSQIDVPDRLMGEGVECYKARRAWILKNRRFAWIEFLSREWARFYQKLFDTVKAPILFNNAWTRDSFEALYRYGIDYRRCCIDRAMGVMVEENSATRGIMSAEDEGDVSLPLSSRQNIAYEYTLMQQDIKLITKGLPQISLLPISDTQEQWDVIRHAPTELARSIIRRFSTYVWRNGAFEVCCNAPHYCLSDGIPAEDWRWLAAQESFRVPTPSAVEGFANIQNPDALSRDVAQFCAKKGYFGSALQNAMIANGLNLATQLSLCEVGGFDKARALLVTNLNTYTKEEKASLAASLSLPLVALGEDVDLPLKKSAHYAGKYLSVAIYGVENAPDLEVLRPLERFRRAGKLQQGEIWTEPLQYKRVEDRFFASLCEILNDMLSLDRAESTEVKVASFVCGEDKYLLLSNDQHLYNLAKIRTVTPLTGIEASTKGCGYRVRELPDGFVVRIPPRSAEVICIKGAYKKV